MKHVLALIICSCAFCYSANAALSGTRTIGPGGNYPSLTAAIADVQAQSLGGALVLELQAAYVGTVETFPLTIPALNGASAVNTLTIRPAGGATALSISSANSTAATVDLNGAQFVTIDGRPGGVGSNAGSGGGAASQLTIANTSASGVAVRFINEGSGNILRYLTLRGVNPSATSGTVVFSTTTGANGNDNNLIDQCDIRDGAGTPANSLYSLGSTGTAAQNNSGNSVANCNILNFYASVDAAGVRLDGGNTDWTLTGNSFYQTVSRAAVAANVRAISISNPSGNNFTVTGNAIGGRAPNAGGAAWTTTGTTLAYLFQGIVLNVGTTTPGSVQGNTIANFVWTTSSTATAPPGVWSGIQVQAGNANIGTVAGNTIGSGTGTGSIAVTTSGNSGTTFGIGSTSSGTVAIANNTIGSITMSGTTTGISTSIIGVRVTAGANTIAGNTIGSTTTTNSINTPIAAGDTGGVQQVTGILSTANGGAGITGNTIANLNNNTVGTVGTSQIRGISTSAGSNTITGNTVRNLSTTSRTSGISALGIEQISTTAGQTVSRNTVHSLSNTVATNGVVVVGIYYAGNTTTGPNLIARNLVHSLSVLSTNTLAAMVIGMAFDTGTFTAQNNMVSVGLTATGANMPGTGGGISDGRDTPGRRFYHNSVYVGGTQTTGTSSTVAFSSSGTTNVRDFRGNIFFNARSGTGDNSQTARHYAVRFEGAVTSTGLTCNNNIYLVTGVGGVLGYNDSLDRLTFAAWKTSTGQDANSYNVNPLYLNPTGNAATVSLHIPANSPANNTALPIAGVTDDFDGDPRSLPSPDIGADETGIAPGVTAQPATNVRANSALLNATVNPNGSPTTIRFEYSTDPTFATGLIATPNVQVPGVGGAVPISAAVSGLTPATVYHVRALAQNVSGTITGARVSFTSNAPPAGGSLSVTPPTTAPPGAAMTATAGGWTDANLPLTYQFFIDGTPLGAAGTSPTVNFAAPTALGLHTSGLRVADGLGDFTEVNVSFTVTNPPVVRASTLGAVGGSTAGIAVAKLLRYSSDPDGDAMQIIAVSPTSAQGGTVALLNGVIHYTSPAGYSGPDSFTYTVRDASGSTAIGTVNVTVAPGSAPSLNVVSITQTADGFLVRFAGIPGESYQIQARDTQTAAWQTLTPPGTLTAGPNGIFEYEDKPNPKPAARFYRAAAP